MKNPFEAVVETELAGVRGGIVNAEFLRQIEEATKRFNADPELQRLVRKNRGRVK